MVIRETALRAKRPAHHPIDPGFIPGYRYGFRGVHPGSLLSVGGDVKPWSVYLGVYCRAGERSYTRGPPDVDSCPQKPKTELLGLCTLLQLAKTLALQEGMLESETLAYIFLIAMKFCRILSGP
jgi:hypothetical protein